MPDREKVIRAVDSCFDYWLDQHKYLHPLELETVRQRKAEALDLLEEQEDVSDALVDQCDRVRRLRKELADQPKIVRCKDCKHYDADKKGYGSCPLGAIDVSDDWFCADGERRSEDA